MVNRPAPRLSSTSVLGRVEELRTPQGSAQATILVAEHDASTAVSLVIGLQNEGFRVLHAMDGHWCLKLARVAQPDLVLLDAVLPKMDGFAVCRTLRGESVVPIVMLTARGKEKDGIRGLELGADDYIVKPCSPSLRLGSGQAAGSGQRFGELLVRVRMMLRRCKLDAGHASAPGSQIVVGDPSTALRQAPRQAREGPQDDSSGQAIVLDRAARQVWRDGRLVKLRRREFDLLCVLMEKAGQAISRHELLDQVWGEDWIGDPRTVDVHVCWLRGKLEADSSTPRYIQTVHGYGYRFVDPALRRAPRQALPFDWAQARTEQGRSDKRQAQDVAREGPLRQAQDVAQDIAALPAVAA